MAGNIQVTPDYLKHRDNADALINLHEFLNTHGWRERAANADRSLTLCMLSATVKRPVPGGDYGDELLDTIEDTIRQIGLDYLLHANLYHLNTAILLVAVVEYVLYMPPEWSDEAIYGCDEDGAVQLYKQLRRSDDDRRPEPRIVARAWAFFRCDKLARDRCYSSRIKYYLSKALIEGEEIRYIRNKTLQLIEDRQDEVPWLDEN